MSKESNSGGTGVLSLLLVAFIILKLCKVIDWSWWWVMAPAWIPLTLVVLILLGVLIYKMFKK